MSDHPEMESLVAAYVLGAAEAQEAEAIRTHIAGCDECRELASRLQRVVDVLPLATEVEHPPARLRAGILARAATVAPGRAQSAPAPRSVRRTRPVGGWWPSLVSSSPRPVRLAIATLLVLVVGLGGSNVWLLSKPSRSQDHVAKTTLAGSGRLLGAQASLIDFQDQGVALVSFSHLPQLPPDQVYELWLIPPSGQPASAGVFRAESDGSKTLVLVKDLKRYKLIAVTIEAGPDGVTAPTQTPGIAGVVV